MVDRLWEGSDWQALLTEEGRRMAKEAEARYQARDNDGYSRGMFVLTRDHKQVGYRVPREWEVLRGLGGVIISWGF